MTGSDELLRRALMWKLQNSNAMFLISFLVGLIIIATVFYAIQFILGWLFG